MKRDLLIAIEEAELANERIGEFEDAICALAERQYATLLLLEEFKKNVLEYERLWRDIEQRSDFKSRYTSREQAHADYLKNYCSRNRIKC